MSGSRSASELLDVWDAARLADPWERSGVLRHLAAAPTDDWAAMPLGAHHAALLTAWQATFGERIDALADCPGCAETVEVSVPLAALPVDTAPTADSLVVEAHGHRAVVRPPSVADVAVAAATPGPHARTALLERCVIEAVAEGGAVAPSQLPAAVQTAVAESVAAADPAADLRLDLSCPECAQRWEEPLDVASLLWAALDAWAWGALADVAVLARTFGWSETDVLALTPARRAAYLELAGP